MANECVINLYSSYDDRGSVSSTLKRRIPIDVSAIIPGKALPWWIIMTVSAWNWVMRASS